MQGGGAATQQEGGHSSNLLVAIEIGRWVEVESSFRLVFGAKEALPEVLHRHFASRQEQERDLGSVCGVSAFLHELQRAGPVTRILPYCLTLAVRAKLIAPNVVLDFFSVDWFALGACGGGRFRNIACAAVAAAVAAAVLTIADHLLFP